ncbi:MAG: hypothetical protein PHZ19_06205 [Candidatus Thermoplasmatota archaeon]|nr:hypothetical protein [Candidatus Thermoplasmatota archaeon]
MDVKERMANVGKRLGYAGRRFLDRALPLPPAASEQVHGPYLSSADWLTDLVMGGATMREDFIKDIYMDVNLTPHQEMWACEQLRRYNAFIAGSIGTLVDVILGDEPYVEVDNDDEYSKDFYERWLDTSGYLSAIREALEGYLLGGNGYIEWMRNKATNMPIKARAIPRYWKVWIMKETDSKTGEDKLVFIEEVPAYTMGDNIKRFSVSYGNSSTYKQSIRGRRYTHKVQHLKLGQSHAPYYGHSPLSSNISDGKILREIERAMAVIARYKAIPRKILELLPAIEGGTITDAQKKQFLEYWATLSDIENPVTSNVIVNPKDLSYAGSTPSFSEQTEYLKKKLTFPVAPEFYVHGSSTTYAVALEQKNLFYLRVAAMRDDIGKLVDEMLNEVRIYHNTLPDNKKEDGWQVLRPCKFHFGEFDIETKAERYARLLNEWNAGIAQLNEVRIALGYAEEKDIDLASSYKWMVTAAQPPPEQLLPSEQSPRGITRLKYD